jgi:iron(III) transport system permease protein
MIRRLIELIAWLARKSVPLAKLGFRFTRGRPGHAVLTTATVAFFVFGLVVPLLYVFKGAFTVPGARRAPLEEQSIEAFAQEHGTTVEMVRKLNGLAPGDQLKPGRALQTTPDGFGFSLFGRLLADPTSRGWIGNSLALALFVTLLTFAISLPLAFFSARREFPGKGLLGALALVPLILPPFVGAIGMQRMLGRFGTINLVLMGLGLIETPFDFLGAGRFWGVALLEALHLYPIMFLNLTAAMANVDPGLEEAASTLGDSGWRRFRRVTLPLMLPGVFAGCSIVFIWAFTDLGTPLVLQYQEVIPKRIYDMSTSANVDPQGYALVVLVLLITAALFAAGKALSKRRPVVSTTKGASVWVPPICGAWERRIAYALFGGITALALLPHVGVVLESFASRWFMTVIPEGYSLGNITGALTHEIAATSVRNSILLSLASTAINLLLGVVLAVFIVRSGSRFAFLVDTGAMLPLAIPGIVLAFGYIGAYSGVSWLAPRNSPIILLVVAYAVRRLPYVVRSCSAGIEQTPPMLEEASQTLGATPWETTRRITLPLVSAHLIAGGILAFSFAMLEVSDSMILAMKEQHYPITKAIYILNSRLTDGPGVACALGLFGVILLTASLWAASSLVGKRLGEMFRA